MRIAYLCPDPGIPLGGTKGASAHVRGLVRAFAALGHQVTVLAPGAQDAGPGIRVVPIPPSGLAESLPPEVPAPLRRALRHLWNNAAVERAVEEHAASWRPALLYERHSPFSVAGGAVAARLGIPHVLEVNAPLAWEGRRYRRQALSEATEALEMAAFRTAGRIVTVSRELEEMLVAAGVPAAKVTAVPNGVDADLFAPIGEAHRRGLEGKLVVGFVGSLKPWHGLEILAKAFRRLAADPRAHLLVVGDGPERRAVKALARELPGRVTQVGAVRHRDVPAYVRAMDVAVAPYPALDRFYFSPLKVLEYMAAGRPTVCAAIGQLQELVRHGETGLLVPPGDEAALAQAIRSLLDDEPGRRTMGAAAANEVRRRHLWTHRAAEILETAGATAGEAVA